MTTIEIDGLVMLGDLPGRRTHDPDHDGVGPP